MRPKSRERTVYVEALGCDVTVRGVPLLKLVHVEPGEPPLSTDLDDIRHPAYTRSIVAHVVDPVLEPADVDALDDESRFVLLDAILKAHPQTRRMLRDETRRAEREGVR